MRKDGSRFWANVTIAALRDRTGQLRGFSKVARDVTERKQAQKKMDDALRYTQSILDTSPLAIITYKASGQAVSANPASAQLVGASVEQLEAQNFRRLESWRQSGCWPWPRKRWPPAPFAVARST